MVLNLFVLVAHYLATKSLESHLNVKYKQKEIDRKAEEQVLLAKKKKEDAEFLEQAKKKLSAKELDAIKRSLWLEN